MVIFISTTFQWEEEKTTKSNIKSSGNFSYLMNTYNTLNFPIFSFTDKLVLRKKGNSTQLPEAITWLYGSQEAFRADKRALGARSQLFEGQRAPSKLWQQNPNHSGFLGGQGHLQDSLRTDYCGQHNRLSKRSGKVMGTNYSHRKEEWFQYKLFLNMCHIGWQSVKQVTMIFVNSL